MRDLAGHHVDFVVQGNGDQEVGLRRARFFQHFRVGAMADDAARIDGFADGLYQFRGRIDDGYVVPLCGKALGDAVPNLSRTADDDPHGPALRCRGI